MYAAEVADELRRSLRAEHRAADEPDQRQDAGHEATADAGERRERHDPDRDPVARCSRRKSADGLGTIPARRAAATIRERSGA